MAFRFVFVFAFQFSMFVLKRFFARVIPDIPKTLELKMKREDHIASTILAETQPNKKAKKTHAKKHN